MIILLALPCFPLVLTPICAAAPLSLSVAKCCVPEMLLPSYYWKPTQRVHRLLCIWHANLEGRFEGWTLDTIYLFSTCETQSLPQAQVWIFENYFDVFQHLDKHEDSEHARNMSNGISLSVSGNDGHWLLGSVPKDRLTQNRLVQTRILFLRVQKFMGNGNDTQVSQSFLLLQLFSSPRFSIKLVTLIIKRCPS